MQSDVCMVQLSFRNVKMGVGVASENSGILLMSFVDDLSQKGLAILFLFFNSGSHSRNFSIHQLSLEVGKLLFQSSGDICASCHFRSFAKTLFTLTCLYTVCSSFHSRNSIFWISIMVLILKYFEFEYYGISPSIWEWKLAPWFLL